MKIKLASLILAASTLAIFSPLSRAQDAAPAADAGQSAAPAAAAHPNPAAKIGEALNFTPDQQTKYAAIMADAKQQQEALKADTTTPKPDKMKKMMAIRKDTSDKINAMLTPDQQAKYADLKKEMMAKMKVQKAAAAGGGQ